ncbi:response regulator [Prosthecomicrobium sp. N25]|uniref:response regulator n=1 Tax=Prosthecomicrobium sp. N25 TaxID=3129254 RepID=UPI003077B126
MAGDKVNILLVDDQPAKLLSYEVILGELGETLVTASSAREALEHLLKSDFAVVLIDVCMPELDGFELAAMIREHPRFEQTAIIFVSAIMMTDLDRLRGYAAGAVDYVPVPVVPEVLRAKVRVFAELHRKTRQLERLNDELERRVAERTAELEASNARLIDSERRRTLALAAGRMGSWDWDIAAGEMTWDEGQHRIFGTFPLGFKPTPQSAWHFVHPDDRPHLEAFIEHALRDATPFDVEVRIRLLSGETRWIMISAAPTFDGEGRPQRLSGVILDITTRKTAEEELQRLNEDLEHRIEERTREREEALAKLFEAQKLDTIGQLTGGVAHDFNNLLMAILGSLELMRKRTPEDSPISRLIENATRGAERGRTLTQRLLAFARRQELKPEAVDLKGLILGMEELLKRALGPVITVDRQIPDGLAPARVDANQLELSLLNLALNARDAMPNGGTLTIRAASETVSGQDGRDGLAPGEYLRICVHDTGLGMDEATLARATEPFFTTKGLGKGTGLGLSMVHGLAAQSGGKLVLSSRAGEGTTVNLWLPRAEPAAASPRPQASTAAAPNFQERRTVLLVDDDPLVLSGTSAMLEDLGHEVIESESGQSALAILSEGRPVDLVITDHAMPGMTGVDLARRIRQSRPDLAIVLATGYAEIPADSGEDASDIAKLAKPYRLEELAAAIDAAWRARAEIRAAV